MDFHMCAQIVKLLLLLESWPARPVGDGPPRISSSRARYQSKPSIEDLGEDSSNYAEHGGRRIVGDGVLPDKTYLLQGNTLFSGSYKSQRRLANFQLARTSCAKSSVEMYCERSIFLWMVPRSMGERITER